jgi:hypothetical protein
MSVAWPVGDEGINTRIGLLGAGVNSKIGAGDDQVYKGWTLGKPTAISADMGPLFGIIIRIIYPAL